MEAMDMQTVDELFRQAEEELRASPPPSRMRLGRPELYGEADDPRTETEKLMEEGPAYWEACVAQMRKVYEGGSSGKSSAQSANAPMRQSDSVSSTAPRFRTCSNCGSVIPGKSERMWVTQRARASAAFSRWRRWSAQRMRGLFGQSKS